MVSTDKNKLKVNLKFKNKIIKNKCINLEDLKRKYSDSLAL